MENRGVLVEKIAGIGDFFQYEPSPGNWATSLRVKDVKKPLEVADDEVLIEVKNVGICGSDVHYWTHGKWCQS